MTRQNHNYPTRMHEVLGVEPYERFSVSSTTPWYGLWLFVDEYGDVREEGIKPPLDRAAVFLVNHPECIIRRPRLTEEQVKQLLALVMLGYYWLVVQGDGGYGYAYACEDEPAKDNGSWTWFGSCYRLRKGWKQGELYALVSWTDPEPLDIVATLKAAGVEVE